MVSLTAYTYWAASKGYDFSYLGPILFVGLIVLVLFGIIQVHFSLRTFFTLVAIFSHSCLQEIYWSGADFCSCQFLHSLIQDLEESACLYLKKAYDLLIILFLFYL